MDTVGVLAIGYASGGTAGAFTGANADWNNRQLHNREIKKIKDIAEQYAKQQGISVEQAENDLMAQAMRDIDKQYADKHAGYDDSAEKFLRKNAGTFYDSESKTNMLMFANNGYYEDSSKFANQTGYATERNRLSQLNNQYSAKDRTNDINYKTNDAIVGGTIKGIKNVPSNLINGGATLLNNVFHTDAVPLVQPAARYANEAEAFVGNQVGENVVNAVSIVTVGLGSVAREVKATSIANQEAQAARNAAKVDNRFYAEQPFNPYHTGRYEPRSLYEKLAMEEAMTNAQKGEVLGNIKMKDPYGGWYASDGWVKMQYRTNGVNVHYIYNKKTGEFTDFKFKDK